MCLFYVQMLKAWTTLHTLDRVSWIGRLPLLHGQNVAHILCKSHSRSVIMPKASIMIAVKDAVMIIYHLQLQILYIAEHADMSLSPNV